ncbi:hypothetical protein FRB95_006118 [Tulasnella sp. JGI-2019a]|nr:hypothetical protein FRB95_006118 [Tulasnella sp. JGI-2019a]
MSSPPIQHNFARLDVQPETAIRSPDHWTTGTQYQYSYHVPSPVVHVEPLPCKTHILVCIQSTPLAANWNKAAFNDIQLWIKATRQTLRDPRNRFYLLTDCIGVRMPADVGASVVMLPPTRLNVEQVIRFATSTLRAMDECTLWFSCTAQENVQAVRLVDPLDIIPGPEIYSWLTENTNPGALIRVGLDFCYSGRFLGLPWYSNMEGELKAELSLPRIIGWTPRIVCISACRSHELAHHVAKNGDPELQWGGLLWYLVWAQLEGVPYIHRIREVEAVLRPRLSDLVNGEWTQSPQVSMSHYEPDFAFRNWF